MLQHKRVAVFYMYNPKKQLIMKTIKAFCLSLIFVISTLSFANHPDPKGVYSEALTKEISKLLENQGFKVNADEIYATVLFTFNKAGEIVVLSVDTEDAVIENFIKERLNYKKPNCNTDFGINFFTLPVKIVKAWLTATLANAGTLCIVPVFFGLNDYQSDSFFL